MSNEKWFQLFDELNSAVRGYKVHPKNSDIDASIRLNGALDDIRKFVESARDEVKNYKEAIMFLRNDYSPVSARGCPACEYVNGKFIKHCKLHEEIKKLIAIKHVYRHWAGSVSFFCDGLDQAFPNETMPDYVKQMRKNLLDNSPKVLEEYAINHISEYQDTTKEQYNGKTQKNP